jgi:hypothetical protein
LQLHTESLVDLPEQGGGSERAARAPDRPINLCNLYTEAIENSYGRRCEVDR